MKREFEEFEYQLNMNTDQNEQKEQDKKLRKNNIVSVLINQETDIMAVCQQICRQYRLNPSLVDILAESIQEQVQKQIIQKQTKQSFQKIAQKGNPTANKPKSFKNKFCSYLNQANQTLDNTDTFRNQDFTTTVNEFNLFLNSRNEYSFRQNEMIDTMTDICFKMLEDSTVNDNQGEEVFEISEDFEEHRMKQFKKSIGSNQKGKHRTVFDVLYQQSKVLERKKEIERKKSFEKMPFKPQLNPMSKKIIELKKQSNSKYQTSTERNLTKSQSKPNVLTQTTKLNPVKNDYKQTPVKRMANENPSQKKSNSNLKNKQNFLTIYQRGEVFRKKSQQKLDKMKQEQFIKQQLSCTFKPKINSKQFASAIAFSRSRRA